MGEKQTILVLNSSTNENSAQYVKYLKNCFEKELVYVFENNSAFSILSQTPELNKLNEAVAYYDPVLIVFFYGENAIGNKKIMPFLKACRDLRIPYLAIGSRVSYQIPLKKIIVPVGFLTEEKEKAPLSNSFAKHCNSKITLLEPKDRGTRAKKNIAFIQKLFASYKRETEVVKGTKNSFKIESEGVTFCKKNHGDLLIISASRAYGLDDNIFGPKEFHILRKSTVPVVVINPREDLYILCGN